MKNENFRQRISFGQDARASCPAAGSVWREVLWYDTIDSTNDALKRRAAQGMAAGTVIVADCQTGGRGRRGRTFCSPAGKGLYLSAAFSPRCAVSELSAVTAWAAVAVCNAVETVCGVRPCIKWPNDLVLNGKKLGGILTESVFSETMEPIVILGIGLNLSQNEADFGPELCGTAVSLLQALGAAPDRKTLLNAVLWELECLFRAFPEGRGDYLALFRRDCVTVGGAIRVQSAEGARIGNAVGISDSFALRVRWEDGTTEELSTGEVSVRGLYGYL